MQQHLPAEEEEEEQGLHPPPRCSLATVGKVMLPWELTVPMAPVLLLALGDRRAPGEGQGPWFGDTHEGVPPRSHPDSREGTPRWQEGRQGSGWARWQTEALQEMNTCDPHVGPVRKGLRAP